MSVLPGGQPLHRVLPDLDELLEDPHVYLSEAPLAIGPRRMYGLAGLFAVPGLALLLSCVIQGKADGERLAMGVGFLLGSGVWLGWSLLHWQRYTFELAIGVSVAEIIIIAGKFVLFLSGPEWTIWRTNWFVNKLFVLACFILLLGYLLLNVRTLRRPHAAYLPDSS